MLRAKAVGNLACVALISGVSWIQIAAQETVQAQHISLAEAIHRKLEARWFYDWGGGLVWLACPAGEDAGAAVIHAAAREAAGHATLIRAPDAVRAVVDVFQQPSAAVMALARKVKASFDPQGLLEPGRMYAGL